MCGENTNICRLMYILFNKHYLNSITYLRLVCIKNTCLIKQSNANHEKTEYENYNGQKMNSRTANSLDMQKLF